MNFQACPSYGPVGGWRAAPINLGKAASFGFAKDPDGNWIEISARASLTGVLPS